MSFRDKLKKCNELNNIKTEKCFHCGKDLVICGLGKGQCSSIKCSEEHILNGLINQTTINNKWLLKQFDIIHDLLCPNYIGTWQEKVLKCIEILEKIKKT